VGKHDVVTADGACGIGVGIARGFVVRRAVIIPVMVEEGVDGVGLEGEGADNGDLKAETRGRAP
jgi:hypothetical protein